MKFYIGVGEDIEVRGKIRRLKMRLRVDGDSLIQADIERSLGANSFRLTSRDQPDQLFCQMLLKKTM